jgi:hypothetical protein
MIINRRFFLDEDDRIIDNLNPANNQKAKWFEQPGYPKDEKCFRELLLWRRIGDLLPNLIINTNPMEKSPNGEEYQPRCEEMRSIWVALDRVIVASHLNTLNVGLSLLHKFSGELRRNKEGMQDLTSLSLFVDDVERLLRDLYGESDEQAIDQVRHAVFVIVEEFTRYLRNDLWQEYRSAQDFDYVFGIGLPDDCGISGSDHRRMVSAVRDLALRARAVRANPAAFSRYTGSFVNKLYEKDWPPLTRPLENAENRLNDMPAGEIPF